MVVRSGADGKFSVNLSGSQFPKDIFYHVAVVEFASCTEGGGRPSAAKCRQDSNVLNLKVTSICSGAGASTWTDLQARGP